MNGSQLTEQGNARAGVGMEPPEGEHFWFEDDGGQLHLKLTPRRSYVAPAFFAFGTAFFVVPVVHFIRTPGLVPVPVTVMAVLFALLLGFSFVVSTLESVLGYESLMISPDRVRLELRIIFPWRRLEFSRGECRNLRVLAQKGDDAENQMAYLCNSRTHGRVGFDTERKTIRLGAQLSEEEAAAIVAFLLSRCPDLGPRGDSPSSALRAG